MVERWCLLRGTAAPVPTMPEGLGVAGPPSHPEVETPQEVRKSCAKDQDSLCTIAEDTGLLGLEATQQIGLASASLFPASLESAGLSSGEVLVLPCRVRKMHRRCRGRVLTLFVSSTVLPS